MSHLVGHSVKTCVKTHSPSTKDNPKTWAIRIPQQRPSCVRVANAPFRCAGQISDRYNGITPVARPAQDKMIRIFTHLSDK